jgi:hypothetical protein
MNSLLLIHRTECKCDAEGTLTEGTLTEGTLTRVNSDHVKQRHGVLVRLVGTIQ